MSSGEMMKLYTIYDIGAEKTGPVFEAVNDVIATRMYRDMLKQVSENDQSDFVLLFLGTIDHSSHSLLTTSILPCEPVWVFGGEEEVYQTVVDNVQLEKVRLEMQAEKVRTVGEDTQLSVHELREMLAVAEAHERLKGDVDG